MSAKNRLPAFTDILLLFSFVAMANTVKFGKLSTVSAVRTQKKPLRLGEVFRKLLSLFLNGSDYLLDESRESGFIVDGEFRELLSVEFDIERFKTGHKRAVFKTCRSASRVDAGNPEAAEFAATNASVAVCVFAGVLDGVFCVAEESGFISEITSCRLQRALSAFARRY